MQQFVRKYLEAYNNFLNKHYIFVVSATILITAISLFFATKLGLKTDFKEMLPTEKYRSVTDLNKILDRVGGVGNLVVAVESDNFEANKKFVQDLVIELNNFPKNYIRYVEYNIEEIKNFYLENKYLYIDLKDLNEIKERLNAKIAYEENKRNPFYVALEDEKAVTFDLSDIEQKYKNKTGEYSKYKDNFFTGENGKLFAVVIKPYGTATQVGFSKKLISEVNKIIKKLDPKKYDPSMKIGLTGKAKTVVNEYQSLKEDLLGTAILCIILVALVIYFYYFRFKVIILSAITVIIGILWTFAFTYFKIGYLNTQTAFLGAIIIGNGVNYGLILLARYIEEEKINHNIKNSLYTALSTTIAGTFASSITTSAGFGTLLLTDVKGYSQFGFIGAIGMFSCWIASYTVLPSLLILTEKIRPMIKARFTIKRHLVSHHFANFVVNKSRYILFSFVLLTLVSITAIITYIPNSLEYDFSKLKTKSSLPEWEASLSGRVTNLFGITITPAIILVDKPDEAEEICNVIMKNQEKFDEKKKTIDKCKTLASHLPINQDEKLVVLNELKKTLQRNVLKLVNPEYQKELEKFKKEVNLKKLTINDLPISIKRNFQELNGTIGTIVFVYPRANANLWYGKNLIKFAESIRENKLPTGKTIHSSSEQVIFADILRAMMHDGPKASFLALFFVIIIILFVSRGFKHAKFIISTLVIGIILMAGIMAIINLKINYFNIVAFPITIGIGIDYAVNLYQRYKYEGYTATSHVLTTTGGAVVTCSLTTIVSYFVLLFAKNQALKSFGLVAIIGELTCLLSAMMLLPSIIMFFNKK